MNVLYVHGSHTVRGGDTVYLHQVSALAPEFGFRCILLSIEKQNDGFTLQLLHEDKQIVKRSITAVTDFIDAVCSTYDIDVIHIHTIYMPAVTAHCLRIRPVFKTPHATDLICPGAYKFFTATQTICTNPFGLHCLSDAYTKRCCSRHPLKLAALYHNVNSEIHKFSGQYRKIIVMSEYVRQECINAGIDENNVEVNHYFTPVTDAVPFKSEGKKRILFFGRLSVIKGIPFLLKAMKDILAKRNDVELHIAGTGNQQLVAKQLADELGISDDVIFHGWQNREDIRRLLESSYMVAVPSIYPEAFGIVGIEAMMCGKPVVGFNVGGISSWLKNDETGFLVTNKDIEGLARSMEALLDNASLYKRMSENARKMAIAKFTPEVHFGKLLSAYKKGTSQLQN